MLEHFVMMFTAVLNAEKQKIHVNLYKFTWIFCFYI